MRHRHVYACARTRRPVRRGPVRVAIGALLAAVVVMQAAATQAAPGVFSLDRLRLGSATGSENYLFTAGNVVVPEGGADTGTYYRFVVTDGAGAVRNPGFPCTPAANFETTDNSYTIAPSDPVSNSLTWKYTLQQFANASCTGTPAKSAFKSFYVAKATTFSDAAMTTQQTVFGAGATAYVAVAGMKPGLKDWTTAWIDPSGATVCANTGGSDRADSDGFGRLPNTVGGFLQYRPSPVSGGVALWNRESNYEAAPCAPFTAANSGAWRVRLEIDATNSVVLPVFTVDASPPPAPSIDSAPADPSGTTSASFAFSSSESGVTFLCQLDGAGFGPCTSPAGYTGLAEAAHAFQVKARDAMGNESAVTSWSWRVDTTAPPTPSITAAPPDPSGSTSASLSFSSSESGVGFLCQLDGGGFSPCTSPTAYSGLADGPHTFQVKARDGAGNESVPVSHTWTVDTGDPATPTIDSAPPDPSSSATASFSFSSTESGVTFQCRLDGAAFSSCTSPTGYSGLGEGAHTFQVKARSAANNESTPATYDWTIDLPPTVTLTAPSNGASTNDTTPSFSGTGGTNPGDSASVTINVYSGSTATGTPVQSLQALVEPGGAFSTEPSTPLDEGTYTAQAEQSDLGGNVGRSSANTFTVTTADVTPPIVSLSTPQDGAVTADSTPTYSGTAGSGATDSASVTVNVYAGTTATGTPVQTLVAARDAGGAYSVDGSPALAGGTYTARAEQADEAGNVGLSSANTFTLDTTPPPIPSITSAPPSVTASTSASFSFSSTETGASFLCELDGGGFAACASPASYIGLGEGPHTFHVKAVDALGNEGQAATHAWTVDTTPPPAPSIDSAPPDPSSSASASFGFSAGESGVTFLCRLDGSSFAACTSPKAYSSLTEGQHTFEVKSRDGAGNESSTTSSSWRVDMAPTVTLTAPSNGATTSDTTPTFSGTAGTAAGDSSSVAIKVYSGPSATGTPLQTVIAPVAGNGSYTADASPALVEGIYTARAEQSDAGGNVGLSNANTFTISAGGYRLEVLADGPRAYWRLGESSGTTAADETGANNGTYNGGVTLARPGPLIGDSNTAASFDGVNDYVTAPDSNSLDTTTAVTVEAWVKRSKSGVWQVVVSKPGNGQSKFENYSIWINTVDRAVAFFGDGATYVRVETPAAIDTNWHHVVATYDNATARIYLDGVLRASVSSTVRMVANALPLNIGRTNGNLNFFGGVIDEVAIYGSALPLSRIQAHYNAAVSFDNTPPVITLTNPANGSRTDQTLPTFSGSAGTAATDSTTVLVKVYSGPGATGTPVQTLTTTRAGGAYSVQASSPLAEGVYTARAEQSDAAGNVGLSSANTFEITFGDLTPPVVSLTQPAHNSTTSDTTPTFSGAAGTAEDDSPVLTVHVYAGTSAAGTPVQSLTTTRDAGGAYSVDSLELNAGTYTAQAEQADESANVGRSTANTFTIQSAYRQAILADSPRAYWRLGESAGATASDQTGANPGTYNGATLAQPGALLGDNDSAVSFNGTSAYVVMSDSSSLDVTAGVTVEAWIKRSKAGAWQVVVSKPGDGQSKNENYSLWISPFDKPVAFFGDGTSFVRVETAGPIDTSWHYVVATYDNATAKIYTDGVLQATTASTVRLTANSLPLNIGRANNNGSFYGGLIDEVAIYGAALTETQIDAHYDAGFIGDTTPPVVTLSAPAQGTWTKDRTPAFAGMGAHTSRDSSTITVRLYSGSSATGTPIQTLTASRFPTGSWGVSASASLADGTYTAVAEQVDTAGNVGLSAANTFTVNGNPAADSDPVMVGAGDIGDCETPSDEAVGQLLNLFPSAIVNTFGDNAYPNGTPQQFANCYDPAWGHAKARTRPALGGHDYQTANAAGYFGYFGAQLAPFGPSATDPARGYYSYNLGTWHVVVLNTECVNQPALCDTNAQITWLRNDLAANPVPCTVAVMPNPRFSSGSIHGNNASMQPFWQALHDYHVELALAGDDHLYERYAPQDAQGNYDPLHGVREFVVGTGGSSHYPFGTIRANSEVRDDTTFGILKVALHDGSYDWEFVPEAGRTFTDSGSAACH